MRKSWFLFFILFIYLCELLNQLKFIKTQIYSSMFLKIYILSILILFRFIEAKTERVLTLYMDTSVDRFILHTI
jgi:hypothetical protein